MILTSETAQPQSPFAGVASLVTLTWRERQGQVAQSAHARSAPVQRLKPLRDAMGSGADNSRVRKPGELWAVHRRQVNPRPNRNRRVHWRNWMSEHVINEL